MSGELTEMLGAALGTAFAFVAAVIIVAVFLWRAMR